MFGSRAIALLGDRVKVIEINLEKKSFLTETKRVFASIVLPRWKIVPKFQRPSFEKQCLVPHG